MKPPYSLTPQILSKIVSISEKIGEVKTAYLLHPATELRKQNRIKTIQSSLGIEGNTLTVEQITAIINNKRVLAPQKDILEVKNAIAAYQQIDRYKPYSIASVCDAHNLLMNGLVEAAGKIRTSNVGIMKDSKFSHIAPPSHLVKTQLQDLLKYVKNDKDPLLIKSCVFHYEFEFIHPFMDGNGRMGRLWQTVLLRKEYPVFDFLPIESLIKKRQADYYSALEISDKNGDSTAFIDFMLSVIDDSLEELLSSQPIHLKAENRIVLFKTIVKTNPFSRKDYMRHFKNISTATASRDLKQAAEQGVLLKSGEGRMTLYEYRDE